MPLYEYDCPKCGRRFEELVLKADEVVKCPSCGSERVKKRLSAFASPSSSSAGGSTARAPT